MWGEVWVLAPLEVVAGETGAAPAGGELGWLAGLAAGVEDAVVLLLTPAGLAPTPPLIEKGPAKARSGEVPNSKASNGSILID